MEQLKSLLSHTSTHFWILPGGVRTERSITKEEGVNGTKKRWFNPGILCNSDYIQNQSCCKGFSILVSNLSFIYFFAICRQLLPFLTFCEEKNCATAERHFLPPFSQIFAPINIFEIFFFFLKMNAPGKELSCMDLFENDGNFAVLYTSILNRIVCLQGGKSSYRRGKISLQSWLYAG